VQRVAVVEVGGCNKAERHMRSSHSATRGRYSLAATRSGQFESDGRMSCRQSIILDAIYHNTALCAHDAHRICPKFA
jgi:hypothetical protein